MKNMEQTREIAVRRAGRPFAVDTELGHAVRAHIRPGGKLRLPAHRLTFFFVEAGRAVVENILAAGRDLLSGRK